MPKNSEEIKLLTKTAMMAALVFVATYFFKIPAPNGYTHLGDCMIFIAVLLLGGKRGALAGGIGACLADMIGGYAVWIIPTFFIKALMALIMAVVGEKLLARFRFGWVVGAVLGGIFQIIAYTVCKFFLPGMGVAYALTRLPGLILQTGFGVIIAVAIVTVLNESGAIKRLKEI